MRIHQNCKLTRLCKEYLNNRSATLRLETSYKQLYYRDKSQAWRAISLLSHFNPSPINWATQTSLQMSWNNVLSSKPLKDFPEENSAVPYTGCGTTWLQIKPGQLALFGQLCVHSCSANMNHVHFDGATTQNWQPAFKSNKLYLI